MTEGCDEAVEAAPEPALVAVLGGDDLAWLRERVRRRLERGAGVTGSVQLDGATPAQRQAVERLLGRRASTAAVLRVDLGEVSAALARAGLAEDIAAAVVALDGPVLDRRAARAARDRAWDEVHTRLRRLAADRPGLDAWVEQVVGQGRLRRLAGDPERGALLVDDLAAVLDGVPCAPTRRERFASEKLGDAHALDDTRPLATLALGAVRALVGQPAATETAEARRESWAAVGVLVDDLLSQVLVLGLSGSGDGVVDRLLTAAATAGEPLWLPLGLLSRSPPRLDDLTGHDVFVVENVSVVAAAADRLGAACAPLVCTGGQPTVAVMRLLEAITARGARLRYHGDFDWGGLTIANRVQRRLGFVPWRFDAAAYREAVAHLEATGGTRRPLRGRPVAAVWDKALAPEMRRNGVRVEEESVLEQLLADLRA